jgi:hypothetical protein
MSRFDDGGGAGAWFRKVLTAGLILVGFGAISALARAADEPSRLCPPRGAGVAECEPSGK